MSVGERQGTGAAAHDEEDSQEDGCGRGDNPARLRWAVNIAKWDPEGNHEGEEFQFLLSLLPDNERKDCLKMMFMPDKKRAIVSRLLQRAACARVTGTLHAHVHINRTKGRKPFLSFITTGTGDFSSSQPARLLHAPNFNFNVSHEGDFVVLASEPSAICGVDVAAPGQARRRGKDGRMPTAEEMLNTFSDVFTPHEKEQIRAAGKNSAGNNTSAEEEDDAKEEVFRRHWSLKESLVKAMGVGLQLELGRAEFHTGGVVGGGEGGGMGGGGGGVGKGGGGLSRRSPDSSDGDDNDPGSPKRDPRRDNPAANFLLFSPSCKRIFVSDGGGDGPSVGGGNGMETARLILDALHNGAPKPKWRFFMQALGESTSGHGGGQHWVTVSRGPAEDVTDANGEFKSTWRKPVYTDEFAFKCDLHRYSEEWEAVLDAPSPFFSMLSVGDLGGAVQVEPS